MKRCTAVVLLLVATWLHASTTAAPLLFEKFDAGWEDRWQHSGSDKYGGEFEVDTPDGLDDPALKVPTKAQFYGISGLLSKPINPVDGLALQFELKLGSEQFGCGGAYLKFLTADAKFVPKELKDDSPYTIMFGPDKCGATNKVHLIFRHKNPKTGTIEEKHLKAPPTMAAGTETHVYTALVKPDNTYAILIDGKEAKAGSLFEDFEPPFLPPKEIPDPEDTKPTDWVDAAKIPDPEATKPDDWDEDAPRTIPDADAVKPEGWLDDEPTEVPDESVVKPDDWDDEEDGEWEPPLVPNPKCKAAPGCGEWQRPTKANPDFKGKWTPPLIDNPEYKGPWKPRDIPNPEFHEDKEPLKHIGNIGAAAIEIWTMEDGYFFDNIVVAATEEDVASIRDTYWQPKHEVEEAAKAMKAAEDKAKADTGELLHTRIVATLRGALAQVPLPVDYSAKVDDALAFLDATPAAVYAMVGAPIVLVLVLVLRLVAGGSKPDAAAVAKKTDAPVPDDAAPAANGSSRGEIQADEDEDTGVRRRTRREQ